MRTPGEDGIMAARAEAHTDSFDISVRPIQNGTGVVVIIDGVEQESDGFEFSAPRGFGLAVRKITRIELTP